MEDLFFNVPSRQRAFRSPSEEYAKILDVVGRYAVHCTGVAFSCKKHGESAMSIATPSNASVIDSIRQIHGSAVANELIEFGVNDDKWGFKASGWTSNANYHVKKTAILLFINHRSVESSRMKRAIEQTYAAYLPKGGHPFIYLSLDIDPQRVDVNVHPTKREVNFLNEEEIIERICDSIREQLAQVDTSRTFTTQSLLPNSIQPLTSTTSKAPPPSSRQTPTRPYENNLVRTDPNVRKITSMLPPGTPHSTSANNILQSAAGPEYIHSPRPRTECRLTTIKHLRAAVRASMHANLTEVFASHTYVGLIDPLRRIVAIQSGVKLFLVDYGLVSQEFFYQIGLTDFGNFGSITFEQPLSIPALITLGVEHEKTPSKPEHEGVEWDAVPELVTRHLVDRREMLLEYFNLDISASEELRTFPLLLKGYTPSIAKLPRFLMRLGPCVNWEDEGACFDSFLRELASFYVPEQLPPYPFSPNPGNTATASGNDGAQEHGDGGVDTQIKDGEGDDEEIVRKRQDMEKVLEYVLFPALRMRLVATKGLLKGVIEVADLKGLYRVFERC